MTQPQVISFFDEATNAVCHIVRDPASTACAVIDSILDFDPASGDISQRSADAVLAEVVRQGLTVEWVLETHVHADHLSAMPYMARKTGAKMGIGNRIDEVQRVFGKVFNAGTDFQMDGSQFDVLFADGDTFAIGNMEVRVMHTPGHTPACVTYVVGDAAFVGDTLFMPDYGTARCDFPGGSAEQLYDSIQKVLSLPDDTRLFLCHDYKAPGRETFCWETTVASEKADNLHVGGGKTQAEFVAFRTERDAKLGMPKLIIPSIQVNMRAGNMPPPEADGETYLKIPLGRLSQL
ncbi:Glyoxylase, beta-lactamase superfamily II [Jannaschia faecimaris]|uniref:Glyoxylase, beta-lactamase superfamily II n=1 Tax=Jannaschia faecimaris TaxID=1244108 RepID=A0A1H3IWL6_9RHOB|nr:MBL fold metallo-hydrolase [Jannaschia faecimaris]SDY32126.1 Glyoxylase, beta-lactamase superfamily II [Jannaschia faecimaris]